MPRAISGGRPFSEDELEAMRAGDFVRDQRSFNARERADWLATVDRLLELVENSEWYERASAIASTMDSAASPPSRLIAAFGEGETAELLATALGKIAIMLLDATPAAENCLSIPVTMTGHPRGKPGAEIVVRWLDGMTPAEKAAAFEREVRLLKDQIAAMRRGGTDAEPGKGGSK